MNKGFVLIASLFLIIFVAIFLGASIMRSDMQLRAITLQRSALNAFCAAEAGIEMSIAQLRTNGQWRGGFTDQDLVWLDAAGTQQELIGIYSVTVATGGIIGNNIPTVILTSTGQDALNTRVRRTIIARVTVENPARFFTSTVNNLTLGDGLVITGSILARDAVFEPGARGIKITGNVEYIRSIRGQNSPGVIIDDNNPNTTPDYYKRAPTAFVGVDLYKFRILAQQAGRYESGNYTISGDINAASLKDPDKEVFNGLVFAEGDVHISGDVQRSLNIVAGGNIYIDDNIRCATYPDTNGIDRQYQIGLSAHNDVVIPENAPNNITIDAFVIADGGVFEAKKTINGKTSITFNGAIAIRGKTDPATGEDLRTGVNLNEYAVRNCVYNTDLRDNPQIPFMNYVVNMVSWQER